MSRTKNPCTICGMPGIPGLIRGAGKCQAHWNNGAHGTPLPEENAPPTVAATMKPFIFGHWHAWQGVAGVLLSNESTKALRQFASADDCINWLFLNGAKDAARALNKHIRG